MDDPGPVERSRPGAAESMPGLSPVRAFFLLTAVAAVIPLGLFATRDEAAPSESPPAVRSPDFSLTDAEAVAEFERLNEARIRAYKSRDVALLDDILTTDSPLIAAAHEEIRGLVRNGVLIRSRFVTAAMEVKTANSTTTVILQTEIDYPKFVTERGRDVTQEPGPQKRVIEWTLHREGTDWKLFNSRLVSRVRLN